MAQRGASVTVGAVADPARLLAVSQLFEQVWGRNDEGVPVSSEMMRSIVHAGGLVSVAVPAGAVADDLDAAVLGAAVAGRSVPGLCYGYIAAVAPGRADGGIGYALKQHQREWALGCGLHTMEWTFDPLQARNARFNLTKLGATVSEYEVAFYGEMHDAQNAGEVGDRLVATWALDQPHGAGQEPPEPPEPPSGAGKGAGAAVGNGPDGRAAVWQLGPDRWIRVPNNINEIRLSDPGAARRWREFARDQFVDAFGAGWVARGVTRGSCYHLTQEGS